MGAQRRLEKVKQLSASACEKFLLRQRISACQDLEIDKEIVVRRGMLGTVVGINLETDQVVVSFDHRADGSTNPIRVIPTRIKLDDTGTNGTRNILISWCYFFRRSRKLVIFGFIFALFGIILSAFL